MNNRELHIDGLENVRDLGGLKNNDGKSLKANRFIRGAALHTITDDGLKQLRAMDISTVIDLRSTSETKRNPDNIDLPHHFHVPMLDQIQSEIANNRMPEPKSMEDVYFHILDAHKKGFKDVFEIIADLSDEGGIFYHCSVGKDRTGLLSMLLLSVADVPNESIIDDYSLSRPLIGHSDNDLTQAPSYLFLAPPQSMAATLDWLEDHFGGPLGYLASIGVTPREIDSVRRSFGIL